MRRIWPEPLDVEDVHGHVTATPRPRPADRPWLLVNMIASLDGAITVNERSGPLGGPADKAMFSALRAVGDVILVGAGTARAEGYGPPRPAEATRAARRERGQAEAPRLALVTRSVDLDLTAPLFTDADEAPLLYVCDASPADRRQRAAEVAEVVVAGDGAVDPAAVMADLHRRGVGVVTCEGGPQLNGDLIAADVIDEWALTVAPLLVGGTAERSSRGLAPPDPRAYALDQVLEGDGMLLTRWVRDRT